MRRHILGMRNFRNDLIAVQAVYSVSAPRIGSVAVVFAFVQGLTLWFDESTRAHEVYVYLSASFRCRPL